MDVATVLQELGLTGSAYAAPVDGGAGAGVCAGDPVTPASVMKIQVALTVESAIAAHSLDGSALRVLPADRRTPGPVGISLMRDDVTISVRDLVTMMLTISDNVATDELIDVVGLEAVNRTTRRLGMANTEVTSSLLEMLDNAARELGFSDFAGLAAHDPRASPLSDQEIKRRLAASSALDPSRGTHTTAADTVRLLQAIWTDRGGPAAACATVRGTMARQPTRNRIASGFAMPVAVAAKSGALLGLVRNEAGVVSFPDGAAYAVAVFTRRQAASTTDPAAIDAAIGTIARELVGQLRTG